MPIDEKNVCFSFIEESISHELYIDVTISCESGDRFAFYADDELVEIINEKQQLVIRCIDDCTSNRVARIIEEHVNDCEENGAIVAEVGTRHTQLGVDFSTLAFYDTDFLIETPEDVRALFNYIYRTLGLCDWHPDDSLIPYAYAEGAQFNEEDFEYLTACVRHAHEWCDQYNVDIYDIGLQVLLSVIIESRTKSNS